jgi:DNA-directed RNA polymerase subunit RPC12/RpoP
MDLETCSWCTAEVEYSTLIEQEDGAMVCPPCALDAG